MLCNINAVAWQGKDGNEDKVWFDSHIIPKKDAESELQATREQRARFKANGNKNDIYT